jgi:pyrroline-5-carboxylate reductase
MPKKIGIIGYGNMGRAIADGIKNNYAVCVFDTDKNKTIALKDTAVTGNLADLVEQSEVIILAAKPQDLDVILDEIKKHTRTKLIISIAAGITTGHIEKILGGARVVRCMPNIMATIADGETVLCKGRHAKEEDLSFAKELFKLLGKVWELSEEKIDSATAISGSGPAYILYDMEINKIAPLNIPAQFEKKWIDGLNAAAIKVGLDSKIALDLAASTTASTIHLARQTGNSPAQLRKMITSPGGTTEAAINVIANGGSWPDAAVAAKNRAQELSKN